MYLCEKLIEVANNSIQILVEVVFMRSFYFLLEKMLFDIFGDWRSFLFQIKDNNSDWDFLSLFITAASVNT